MIVRITTHGRTKGVVLVHTPPDLAHAMGLFQPARWSPKANAYLLGEEHLGAFRRHLGRHDAQVVDERSDGVDDVEKFAGPLPECSACGQAATRQQALALNRCPGCGAAWRPVVHQLTGPAATYVVECPVCGRRQRAGFAFCGGCGAPAEPPPPAAPRPLLPEPERARLEDPVTVGQVLDDQLELEDRDHMERAAGDR